MDFSPVQIGIVLLIILLVFGPKRLPELGRSMGRGIREFKGSITGDKEKDKDENDKPGELRAAESGEPVEGEVVTENKA